MKKMRRGFAVAAFAAMMVLLQVPSMSAQDQYQDQGQGQDQDPPAIAGRMGFVEGSVSFQPGGQGDWVTAVANRPLTVGDNLWVDRDSRAEVQVGSTSISLGPETSLTFLDVEQNAVQLRLSMGSVYFHVRRFEGDQTFEVDTPNLAFNVNQPGQYRLTVNENGDQTSAAVWRGDAEVTGAGNSYRLNDGQEGVFSGTDQLSYDVSEIRSDDPFTRWAMDRDSRWDRSRSRQYVSQEMTGYQDLDDYGQWSQVGEYGNVWRPTNVGADWAPYRNGHWAWIDPWGWNWVDDEPWGFAPFHYGRWAYVQSSWCWVPGPVAAYPVYSPALVAFVGGGGFSIGVGVGEGVGWFPLAPGEVYVPWYHTSPRYVENINVTNTRVSVTQVTNVYRNVTVNKVTNITYVNQRNTRAVTVVNRDTFVNSRSVQRNVVKVDERQLQQARVSHDVVRNIQPTRQSVVGEGRPSQARAPQQALARQVVATRQPREIRRQGPGERAAAAPPPIRTVKPAARGQAQSLQKGARGGPNPPAAGANRPENNRPGAGNNNPAAGGRPENNRPGAGNNNPAAGGRPENNNRPGAPENRPGAAENRNGGRPGAPDNNRPGAENRNNVPRPGAPDNNRPGAENRPGGPGAPENRPGANNREAGRPNEAPRPGAADNGMNRGDNGRPANAGPDMNRPGNAGDNRRPANAGPDMNRPGNAGDNRPGNAGREEAPRPGRGPDAAPADRGGRPAATPETRPNETPSSRPEQPARPPDARRETAPRESSPAAAGRPEMRPESAPRPEPAARNDNRGHANEPPARNDNKRADENKSKDNKDNKDNRPPQYR